MKTKRGTTDKAWYVCERFNNIPIKHPTKASAQSAADDLAIENPGKQYLVLESVTMHQCIINPPQTLDCVETNNPF